METTGGVAPVCHPQPLRTVVDITLPRYDELLRITAGEAAEIGT